ncbi:hypothetical protein B0182_01730 [Moraxella bovis]|nr:hypothetical protein DQF64_06795 [Moraxella bovis]OOR92184.1 hypothetical protein B0182_01730 [Moraxella bovis]
MRFYGNKHNTQKSYLITNQIAIYPHKSTQKQTPKTTKISNLNFFQLFIKIYHFSLSQKCGLIYTFQKQPRKVKK